MMNRRIHYIDNLRWMTVSLLILFYHTCGQNGIMHNNDDIFAYLHRFEEKTAFEQLSLW